jgi:hypothetical protein
VRGCRLQLADAQTVIADLNPLLRAKKQHEIVPLTDEDLMSGEPNAVREVLAGNDGELLKSTPLWFYVLKEACVRGCGNHLGPLGSRIVMETIHGVLWYSKHSILRDPKWVPTLPSKSSDRFTMADLLAYVGEANPITGCMPMG